MPIPQSLNTNEVKDRAGVEREFLDRGEAAARSRVFYASTEAPNLPERITIQHREIGKPGLLLVRQSNLTLIKTIISPVDNLTPVVIRRSITDWIPQGAITDYNACADVAAWSMSLLSTTGAATTVLFDGSGTMAVALRLGTL